MKILKYFLLLFLVVVIGGAIYIATLDSNYDVKRSHTMNAPVAVVYNNVNDYKNWPEWSPWLEKDTTTVLTYTDNTVGAGASYSWKSDHEEVGEGSMETTNVKLNETINQHIKFIAPWQSESDIYWTFSPAENGMATEVTWGMKGEMGFMDKAFITLGGGMDKMVGPDYEKGLRKLDSVISKGMKKYSVKVDGITTHSGGYYIYNTTSCKIDEMPKKMAEMMPKVGAYAAKNKITMAGPAFSLYHKWDQENNAVIFSCAVPVTEKVITDSESGILTGELKPFKALKTTLTGNYENLFEAWTTSDKYIKENNLEEIHGHPALEVYANDPMEFPNPADWITEIYIPVKG